MAPMRSFRMMSGHARAGFATLLLTAASTASAAPGSVYVARCAMCHQSNAQGLAGQFPRLAGRTGDIAATPAGRAYLARVVLHGMYGKIVVDGAALTGLMPGMAAMTDADIAAALNHVVTVKKPARPVAPFTAAEVAAVRATGKFSGTQNAELRRQLVEDGKIAEK